MKRKLILLSIFLLLALVITGCKKEEVKVADETSMSNDAAKVSTTIAPTAIPTIVPTVAVAEAAITETATTLYKDGVYEVQTAVDNQQFIAKGIVTIEGDKFTAVEWDIVDSYNRALNEEYYKVFEAYGEEGKPFIQWAKDNWSDSRGFTDALLETQDINQITAGKAEWAYGKYKDIIRMAVKEALINPPLYKDGVYEVKTPVDIETYFTQATITIESGKITAADWTIYDSSRDNKPFDEEYYHVYEGENELYTKQCIDDWANSRGYSDALIETQDIDDVDVVSGATWTYRLFKDAVNMALDEAIIQ